MKQIKLTTKTLSIEGILIQEKEEILVVKLSSGYNIGIKKSEIIDQQISELKEKKKTKKKRAFKKGEKKICILQVGGTIASKVDYETGAVVSRYEPEELYEKYGEVFEKAAIDLELLMNTYSGDFTLEDFSFIAKEVYKRIEQGYEGVIVTQGTDTMATSAAFVSFALEHLQVPVLFTGSQRSSDRPSTDAYINLQCAIDFICQAEFGGVALCMHKDQNDSGCAIIPAVKARKLHTSRRDAFAAVNTLPVAFVDTNSHIVYTATFDEFNQRDGKKTVLKEKYKADVALLKYYPNFANELFDTVKNFSGVILEGTGLGHFSHDRVPIIKSLVDGGCVVGLTSQCIHGRVHQHVYSYGVKLAEAGAIGAQDMLSETAFVKLAWLLGNYSAQDTKKLFSTNLRGEIGERRVE